MARTLEHDPAAPGRPPKGVGGGVGLVVGLHLGEEHRRGLTAEAGLEAPSDQARRHLPGGA